MNENVGSSPATRFLASSSYVSDGGTIEEDIHPYAFSAKVQTHCTDNPTYKDILRLPEKEKRLWDIAMVKDLKILQDLGSFKTVARPRGSIHLLPPGLSKRKGILMGYLKNQSKVLCAWGSAS